MTYPSDRSDEGIEQPGNADCSQSVDLLSLIFGRSVHLTLQQREYTEKLNQESWNTNPD